MGARRGSAERVGGAEQIDAVRRDRLEPLEHPDQARTPVGVADQHRSRQLAVADHELAVHPPVLLDRLQDLVLGLGFDHTHGRHLDA